ncbi:DMT family transporter [Paracrocinitomix mangrovi]|uniref:DMT family transporter n=1 Tax=Paracrocinitomix mangrovi TaxID=2862509 RepID=UPI001C8E8194|nr:DMT family transporter [Paracrocinitomix mangrovi]UKN00504.1 DMT family transporter [Paracrocinitomix mangrovi]
MKYYIILHLVVLVFGFTGILGDYISVSADFITFFRTGISFISLILIGFFIKTSKIQPQTAFKLILIGGVVGLHWFMFFYAIKVSTVSIGVVCMSSATLFTSILEPIVFKRKFQLNELFLSFAIIGGIMVIFGFETEHYIGILAGLLSAFLAALFTVLNGKLISGVSSFHITKYEMLGGFLTSGIFLLSMGKLEISSFNLSGSDWTYLLVLGLICTTVAFMLSVWVMKFVTPFTVSMSVNMEPIYTILIVLLIDVVNGTSKEKMSTGFYFGTAIILASIFLNAYLKKQQKRKLTSSQNLVNSI